MTSPTAAGRSKGDSVAYDNGFCAVIIEDLKTVARIGVDDDEQGIKQPLAINVRIVIEGLPEDRIDQTFDYRDLGKIIELLASEHFQLIETFAQRLARACLTHPLVVSADIMVSKPCGLSDGLAKCQVILARDRGLAKPDTEILP